MTGRQVYTGLVVVGGQFFSLKGHVNLCERTRQAVQEPNPPRLGSEVSERARLLIEKIL